MHKPHPGDARRCISLQASHITTCDETNNGLAAAFSDYRNKEPSAVTTDHLEKKAHVQAPRILATPP